MRLKSFLPLALAFLLPAAAHADTSEDITLSFLGAHTDSFSFTIPGYYLTGSYTGRPPYLDFGPVDITFDGVVYPSSDAIAAEDQGLYMFLNTPPYGETDFTGNGIYTVDYATDTDTLNLGSTTLYENGNPGTLTISQTPEPTTLTLLATGLLGLGATLRRRLVS